MQHLMSITMHANRVNDSLTGKEHKAHTLTVSQKQTQWNMLVPVRTTAVSA